METFLQYLLANNFIEDALISSDEKQFAEMWSRRELIPEACSRAGAVYKYDVSLDVRLFPVLIQQVRSQLASHGLADCCSVIGYGHAGDGNLHLNVSAPSYNAAIAEALEPFIWNAIKEYRGSI